MPSSDVEKVAEKLFDEDCSHGGICRPCGIERIAQALTSAHAQGYKAGVEESAGVADAWKPYDPSLSDPMLQMIARAIATTIRKLVKNG